MLNTWLILLCDAPEKWQVTIQDPASPALEGMITFHEYLLFMLLQVGVFVCWFLWNNNRKPQSEKFTHESLIEILWTFSPAIILLFIAVPSFILLYSLSEALQPVFTVKVVAHQWYWSYEYTDFFSKPKSDRFLAEISFDSYLVSSADLIEGSLRLLEVDRRIVMPANTHIRLLICSGDVLHSWAVPATGVKLDACPGRISEVNIFLKRPGVYYGQCSEICGTNHGLMPIVIQAVPAPLFFHWLHSKVFETAVAGPHLFNHDELWAWSDTVISVAHLFSIKTFRATTSKVISFLFSHFLKEVWLYFFVFFLLVSFFNIVYSPENYFLLQINIVLLDGLSGIGIFGQALYNYFSVLFLLSGVVLLIALIGAIMLTPRNVHFFG